jgi:hypothetical protein
VLKIAQQTKVELETFTAGSGKHAAAWIALPS